MDWFGNLPVADHGGADLSIYGNRSSADPVLERDRRDRRGYPVAAGNRVYTLSSGIWAGRSILFAG
jgi:hypothetical protein